MGRHNDSGKRLHPLSITTWKVVVIALTALTRTAMAARIQQLNPCSALIDNRLINLQPLGRTDGNPRFQVQKGTADFTFNPCVGFNYPEDPRTAIGERCYYVAMCQTVATPHGLQTVTRGIQRTASFHFELPLRHLADVPADVDAGVFQDALSSRDQDKTQGDDEESVRYLKLNNAGFNSSSAAADDGDYVRKSVAGDTPEVENDDDKEREEDDENLGEQGEIIVKQTKDGTGRRLADGIRHDERDVGGEERTRRRRGTGRHRKQTKRKESRTKRLRPTATTPTPSGQSRNQTTSQMDTVKDELAEHSRIQTEIRRRTETIKKAGRRVPTINHVYLPTSTPYWSGSDITEDRPKDKTVFRNKGSREQLGTEKEVLRRPLLPNVTGDVRGGQKQLHVIGEKIPTLKLKGIQSQKQYRVHIYLVCQPRRFFADDAYFQFVEQRRKHMYFELHHRCCCPGGCQEGETLQEKYATTSQQPREDSSLGVGGGGPRLMWIIIVANVGIFVVAAIIGSVCCRAGASRGPYTMLPGLHASRLTLDSVESFRMPNKVVSAKMLDYSSPKFKDPECSASPNGIISGCDLEVGQRLGGGLFGDTYLCEWKDLIVAAKRLTVGVHQGQMTDADVTWLSKTILQFSRMKHKNVVSVLGICFDLRQPHVVKEFVEGSSLRDLLQTVTDGSFTFQRKVRMLEQAAEGLVYLHSSKHQVLHRDLRCANILASKTGDHVKITDFGMVMLMHRLRVQCTGRPGCYCHKETPAYPASIRWTAPEVLSHPKTEENDTTVFTPSCDIYSFGMTMWETVNVSDPWHEVPDEDTVVQLVIGGSRPDVSELDASVAEHYIGIMVAAWNPNPNRRPSIKQIASHLSIVKQHIQKDTMRKTHDSESSTMTYFRSALNIAGNT